MTRRCSCGPRTCRRSSSRTRACTCSRGSCSRSAAHGSGRTRCSSRSSGTRRPTSTRSRTSASSRRSWECWAPVPELRIVVTCPPMQRTAEEWLPSLTERGIAVEIPPVTQHVSRADLERILPTCDGIIAGDEPLDRALLASAAPRLRVISRWGVGIDNIDLQAAGELGIEVRNTPAAFADEVADVAIGYMIMLARHLHAIDAGVRAGEWPKPQGVSLAGRTLGIVGLGAIGRAVAKRGLAMGMTVVGTDPTRRAAAAAVELGVHLLALDDVIATADVLSLNLPMSPANQHLLDADRFARMKPGAFLV